jgi:predicted transcriptional regulator
MESLTINLSDEQLDQLQAIAAQRGVSAETLVQMSIAALLTQANPSFEEAADYVMQKNAELYQRLA